MIEDVEKNSLTLRYILIVIEISHEEIWENAIIDNFHLVG